MELYSAWSSFDDEYFRGLEVYDPEEVTNPDDWQTYYNMMYADRQREMAEFVINALRTEISRSYLSEPCIFMRSRRLSTFSARRGTL